MSFLEEISRAIAGLALFKIDKVQLANQMDLQLAKNITIKLAENITVNFNSRSLVAEAGIGSRAELVACEAPPLLIEQSNSCETAAPILPFLECYELSQEFFDCGSGEPVYLSDDLALAAISRSQSETRLRIPGLEKGISVRFENGQWEFATSFGTGNNIALSEEALHIKSGNWQIRNLKSRHLEIRHGSNRRTLLALNRKCFRATLHAVYEINTQAKHFVFLEASKSK